MTDDDDPIRETTGERNPFASPLTETDSPAGEGDHSADRSLRWLLFSFRGRIPRRIMWRVWIGMFAALVALEVCVALLDAAFFHFFASRTPPATVLVVILVAGIAFAIALIWVGLVVQLKRWHDRDKSVWWLFINLVPYVGWLWVLIELGCLRGTKGPNRYGPDPS